MRSQRALAAAAVAAVALAAAGCGDDSSSSAGEPPPSAAGTSTSKVTLPTPTPTSTSSSKKPKVAKAHGPAPTKLVIKDLKTGTGPAAKNGDLITVQYVGVDYKTGKQFDASWDRGQPFQFQLGGDVIAGWNQGLVGMKAGGRRQLTIPPDLAYGPGGAPPDIGPNATLIFVVDLLKIG